MKKVLLATTALTLSAGIAAAEGHSGLKITGFAEMGINDNGDDDVQFFQDIDVTFSGSGTTDNGLSFGFTVDLDEVQQNDDGSANGAVDDTTDDGGASIFISGDFGTLTLGDTDGALDWALQDIGSLGSIDDAHTIHGGYTGNGALDGTNDGQVLRYDHTIGDFSFAVSLDQDVAGTGPGDTFGVGAKGSFGDIAVGLGYQENDDFDAVGISVGASLGDIEAVVNWWDADLNGTDQDFVGIGLTYTSGPLGLHINYGQFDNAKTDFNDDDGFGVAVNYDLGGGAEVQFGYGSNSSTAGGSSDDAVWSLGVAMSF